MNAKKLLWLHSFDGEWVQCRKCAMKGYGVDAYHPFTSEFFPMLNGKLRTDRCRACASESQSHTHGMVPDRKAA